MAYDAGSMLLKPKPDVQLNLTNGVVLKRLSRGHMPYEENSEENDKKRDSAFNIC